MVDYGSLKSVQTLHLQNLGLVYTGTLLNNAPHGEGSLFSTDGKQIFKGNWVNGSRNGFGHYIYPDGT
jgi:hypothetical protein